MLQKKTELSQFWPKGTDIGLLTLEMLKRFQDTYSIHIKVGKESGTGFYRVFKHGLVPLAEAWESLKGFAAGDRT